MTWKPWAGSIDKLLDDGFSSTQLARNVGNSTTSTSSTTVQRNENFYLFGRIFLVDEALTHFFICHQYYYVFFEYKDKNRYCVGPVSCIQGHV